MFYNEYWWKDGYLESANDGDHEIIATNSILEYLLSLIPFGPEYCSDTYGFAEFIDILRDDEDLPDYLDLEKVKKISNYDSLEDFVEESSNYEFIATVIKATREKLDEKIIQHLKFINQGSEFIDNNNVVDYNNKKQNRNQYGGDSRKFACEVYGWVAIRGTTLDMWDYDKKKAKTVIDDLASLEDFDHINPNWESEIVWDIAYYKNDTRDSVTYEELNQETMPKIAQKGGEDYHGDTDYWKSRGRNIAIDDTHPFYKNRKGYAPLGDNFALKKFSSYINNKINKNLITE